MWSVVQGTVSGVSQAMVTTVLSLTQAAANYWGFYVDDRLANITIRVSFTDLDGTTLATGGTDFQFLNSSGGLDFFEPNPVRELRTGVDPNGSSPDIRITIDSSRLASNGFYLGAPADGYISTPTPGRTDLFTVLLHEIGHGLGLLSFLDEPGNDRSTFDRHVTQSGGNFSFNGPNAVAAFGGPIPLDDSIAHVSQSLSFRLFRPQISSGVASFIFPFETAIAQDFGVPLRAPTAGADVLRGYTINDTIDALGGNDFIDGLLGRDTLNGGAGADTLIGSQGDDLLDGGAGADILDGGDGFDEVLYLSATAAVLLDLLTGASAGDAAGDAFIEVERFVASPFNDTIIGGDAADLLDGAAGDDLVFGGDGADTLTGDDRDTLVGGAGADTFDLLSINQTVSYRTSQAGVHVDIDSGFAGFGDAEGDIVGVPLGLEGSEFGDTLAAAGLPGSGQIIHGLGGPDLLRGGLNTDRIDGGSDADTISGGAGADTLDGGTAFDTLDYSGRSDGGVNVNVINGVALTGGFINSAGFYQGGIQEDTISNFENILGTGFRDRLIAGSTSARIEGRDGDDFLFTFSGNDTLFGGDGNDFIASAKSSDQLFGENGDDTLNGGTSFDTLDGGDGSDTADYADRDGGVSVNLFSGVARTAGALNASGFYAGGFNEDVLIAIENATGSAFGDRLVGAAAGSRLDGGGGNDNISGLVGADTLIGGLGDDTLSGGAGADIFEFALGFGVDRIVDFLEGAGDVILLAGLGPAFDSFEDVIAAAAQSGDDVIFDFGAGDAITVASAIIADFAPDDFAFG